MRASTIVLVLLLAVPVVDAALPTKHLVSRYQYHAGWVVESFTLTNGSEIRIFIGDESGSDVVGHILALYDDQNKLLRGTTLFSVGGQVVEASLGVDGTRVSNEGAPGLVSAGVYTREIRWACDAACNPSRKFKLAATGGGELDWWGIAVYTNGANLTANTSGTDAFAYTTHQFRGNAALVSTPFRTVHVAEDVTMDAQVDDRMLMTFVKPSEAPARRISVSQGATETACPCFGEYGPGGYTFHYDDLDTSGVEGYLTYADVRLPP